MTVCFPTRSSSKRGLFGPLLQEEFSSKGANDLL